VKNAVSQLAALVTTPPAGRAPDLLADIFSVTIPTNGDSFGVRRPQPPLSDAAAAAADLPNLPIKAPEHRIKILPITGGLPCAAAARWATSASSGGSGLSHARNNPSASNPFDF
jgi:hypothetical protein